MFIVGILIYVCRSALFRNKADLKYLNKAVRHTPLPRQKKRHGEQKKTWLATLKFGLELFGGFQDLVDLGIVTGLRSWSLPSLSNISGRQVVVFRETNEHRCGLKVQQAQVQLNDVENE